MATSSSSTLTVHGLLNPADVLHRKSAASARELSRSAAPLRIQSKCNLAAALLANLYYQQLTSFDSYLLVHTA